MLSFLGGQEEPRSELPRRKYNERLPACLKPAATSPHNMSMSFHRIRRAFAQGAVMATLLSSGAAIAADLNAAALDALRAAPDAMGAVRLTRGNGAIFCTLGKEVEEKMVADNARTAVLYSPEFRVWHDRGKVTSYAEVRTHVGELLASMKNGRCNVAVENAANILALADQLRQEGMIFLVFPSPILPAQIADLYANSLGFASNKDLLLAEHMRVNNEELQSYYKTGITSAAAYDDAVARMRSQDYSKDPRELPAFLKDEEEGTRRNLPAAAIREERNSQPGSR
jgi:hypothetical protein